MFRLRRKVIVKRFIFIIFYLLKKISGWGTNFFLAHSKILGYYGPGGQEGGGQKNW
jgi:hypothetical protein